MAHLTDTTATNAQATPRRSPRPKASKEQVSNVNTQEQTMTTSTAAAPAADTTFADVADATAGTTGTPGTSAPEAQPAAAPAAPKASTTDGYVKVRVFVLATTQDGTPEFFTAMVGTTADEIAAKKHHGKAARKAANEGYKWPMMVFDQNSTAGRQLEVMAGRQRDAMNRA
ncbi:hypothetical protein [Burkholderia vietnamiensis]|uniref:hypothetical protein n=1 Tax=Burkholderia vietnamiensis TaxID=60552 RepID=UPI001CF2258A|nr:hypothetical protein [Burkholderia vietnamiensis]MCA8180722.1 hypothetical protein [Burkholderia vietnamiensis]UEC01925.1 hypothetical protein LK462_07855 [Burkholderia vietnamiensis]